MLVKCLIVVSMVAGVLLSGFTSPAFAVDPCQVAIVKSLAKYKKVFLKSHAKCLDLENKGVIAPDSCVAYGKTVVAVGKANAAVKEKVASACTLSQITTLGYRTDCQYEAATAGRESQCAALPVTSTGEFSECMKCWKGAELSEYLAILYASRAMEVCGNDLGETSPVCSAIDCSTPLPDQRVLGDNAEGDCQRGIGKAGVKYLLKREKVIEKCLLKDCTKDQCLAGTCAAAANVPILLDKAEVAKANMITKKCGNRDPSIAAPSFCCRCGTGNQCMLIADQATCEATPDCSVQSGKTCNNIDLTCEPGPKTITWWNNCPESAACPGAAVTTLDQLISCVDTTADAINDELLCLQFPGYPCPPPDTATTTTTLPSATTTTVP